MTAVAPARNIPRILLVDPELLQDPFTVYGRAREESPLARLLAPGVSPIWAITRYEDAKAFYTDQRFVFTVESLTIRPDLPEASLTYLESMLLDGDVHRRLRRLVAPAFTPRRAAAFRPQMETIVENLMDNLAANVEDGRVDLLKHFARPLPIDTVCELLGMPPDDRERWREYGTAAGAGESDRFAEAMPGMLEKTAEAIARRRSDLGEDVISDLVRIQAEDGDRLSDKEIAGLIWLLIVASSTTADFVANAAFALLTHPQELAALRADTSMMPRAVEELLRWCSLNVISIPRYAREDLELFGVLVREGDPVVAVLVSCNRDPRVFEDPDRLDFNRPEGTANPLTFAHGSHICIGASISRVLLDVAFTGLLRRFPNLALAVPPEEVRRVRDPGTWRVEALPVSLTG